MPELPFDIGLYRAVEQVGVGGMGRVYRGIAPDGKEVAIKTMHSHLFGRKEFVRRFMLEAERLQRVAHPGVVRVYEYGSARVGGETVPYIVMEFVRGRKLSDILDDEDTGTANFTLTVDVHPIYRKVVIPQDGVVRILRQMAFILQACSQVNVVHRDIKPANIIITDSSWRVKLIDFGIAKDTAEKHTLTEGQVLGTPAYMSPEQWGGTKEMDIRSDIYALGVVAYRCLTGRVPFEAESLGGYMKKHLEESPTRIRKLNPNVDENLALIVERMLAKEPENRHQKPDELIEDLMRYERGERPVRVYDWETRTIYENEMEVRVARKRAKVRGVLHHLALGVGIAAAVILLAFVIAAYFGKPLDDPIKPLLTKANSLAVRKLPEAAAFWYDKARDRARELKEAGKLKKDENYIERINQKIQKALKAADAKPLLLVHPDSKSKELLSEFVRRYWSPIAVTEPNNPSEKINWSDKKQRAEVLRGKYGIRYVLRCTLTEISEGWQATVIKLDLRTGEESTYKGVWETPDLAIMDAFLVSVGMKENQRKIRLNLEQARRVKPRDKKIEYCRKVLKLDPTNKEAKEAVHRLYIEKLLELRQKQRFADVLTVANEALEVLPDDEEVRRLKEEAERTLRGISLEKQLEKAKEALRYSNWAKAIEGAEAVLKQKKDDKQAKEIKEAATTFRAVDDALTSANLNTARQKVNEAKKLRSLAPEAYDSLLNELKEKEKQYKDLLRQIEEALKDGRPEDVEGLVKQVKSENREDTVADELLAKAKKVLSKYKTYVGDADEAMQARRYNYALDLIGKAEKLRKSGPHEEMKRKAEAAVKMRERLREQIERAAAQERWERVKRLGLELQRWYPERWYPKDAYPKRINDLVDYAKLLTKAEKHIKTAEKLLYKLSWKRAYYAYKAAKRYRIGSKKEKEIERRIRLLAIILGEVYQKVVNAGGEVVCIAGALDRPLFLAGLADGRFVVVSADGLVKRVFNPPKGGVKPVAAAFVRTNFLLLWSDGSLQIRRNDGSLIASKRLPAPRWVCSFGDAVIMWDGRELRLLLGEEERRREMSEVSLLGAGAFLALRNARGRVVLLDRQTLRVKSELFVIGEVVSCATNREMVALGLRNGVIELRRLSGKVVKRIKPLRWFPRVLVIDCTGDFLFAMDKNRTAALIRLDTGIVLWREQIRCWAPAGATIVGRNDALAIRGETGKLILLLPSLRP